MNKQIGFSNTQDREQLAKQFQPLVYKIVRQQLNKTPLCYEDILGFAEEGLARALNTYDPTKGQTFKQYAGYCILYSIQNGTNNEGHTVKFSAYMQQKTKKAGGTTWIMKSIDIHTDDDGEEYSNIPQPCVDPEIPIDNIFSNLHNCIESKFSKRDCDIFYQVYGLKNFEITKGTDLAKKYNCSGTNITLICQKIISYIRTDEELMDELSDLL